MFILGSIAEQDIGQWHRFLFYFPLILFITAFICDILYYFGKNWAFTMGHWMVIFGVMMCVPTLATGLEAAQSFDPQNIFLIKHRFLGYATGVSGSLYAGLRISVMWWKQPIFLPSHYVGLSFLLVALVFWTSDYGGLLLRVNPPHGIYK